MKRFKPARYLRAASFNFWTLLPEKRELSDPRKQFWKFRAGYRHFGLLLRALSVVVCFRILLYFRTYRQLSAHIRVRPATIGNCPNPRLVAWAIKTTASIVPTANCLTQALSTQYILARAGTTAVVRVGIAQDENGRVEAHAWVLENGAIILGGTTETLKKYAVLTDLSPLAQ